jgi:muramoyltetrapeptide carboxypeptidase
MPIKPRRLEAGDTVGIVAPASAPPDPEVIERAGTVLEGLGFRPKFASNVRKRWGFLAGNDKQRARDIMEMFADRNVKAIFCVRGGYGSARLLGLLDYQLIRRNPKIFVGYSDITSLHCAFLRRSNLASFHGPMLNSDFVKEDLPEFTLQSFLRTVMEARPAGDISQGAGGQRAKIVRSGKASGRLIGGNLSLLCTTVGTPFQPSFKHRILFLEDLDEPPYRLDRMLTHLANAGLLQQVAGVAVGINKNCEDPKAGAREFRQSAQDVLRERLLPLKVPVVTGLPFGHVPVNATIPVGLNAMLDAARGELVITEAAVV